MLPIERALFHARDRALPAREQATLNELCRQIVELLRRPSPTACVECIALTDNAVALRRP
jgi:hypothetical protein